MNPLPRRSVLDVLLTRGALLLLLLLLPANNPTWQLAEQ
jgi:hypothetical protein